MEKHPYSPYDESTAKPGRARAVLLVAVTLLLALLVALVVVFYNMLTPPGESAAVKSENAAKQMIWVRSLYGFGPSADAQLKAPTSVAVAPTGDIYATDPSRARVMVFRPDGTFRRLVHTGGGGTGQGEFVRPESIDIDDAGNLYIADSVANKIIVFDADGQFVREWPVATQARGVSVSDGKVYVLGIGQVIVYDANGAKLVAFGQRGNAPGQIDAYQGVVAREGYVYVADAHNKRLQAFDAKGKPVWTVPGGVAARTGPSSRSRGADESASDTAPGHKWDLPQDLVFDGSGQLVVADAFQFELAVVDPETGKVQATYGEFGSADGEFRYPTSVDYDARRDWFVVADTENNRVQIVEIAGSGNPNAAAVWRALSSPYRYLLVPALFLLAAIILATWVATRILRANKDRPPMESRI